MQLTYAAVLSILASAAYSQSIQDQINTDVASLPSCSLTCLTNAITAAGCGISDYACQCGAQKNAITAAVTPCLESACSSADFLSVTTITTEICVLVAKEPASTTSPAASVASTTSGASTASSGSSEGSTASTGSTGSTGSTTSSAPAGTTSSPSTTSSKSSTSSAVSTSSAAGTTTSAAAKNPGNKLQAGAVVAGAAAMVAMVL